MLVFQIIQAYAHGWDFYAEALLSQEPTIKDIGPQLMQIAGKRLNLLTKNDPRLISQIAGAGSLLFDYLESLVSEKEISFEPNLKFFFFEI